MTTHARQIIQVEGYEFDYIWDLAQVVIPKLTRPADCPEWALAMWEAVLRLPGRSTWTAVQRRAAIAARIGQAISATEIKAFLAAEALCSSAALTLVAHATPNQVDVTTSGLSAGQVAAIKAASLIVFAAHLKITVDGVTIR